MEPRIHSSVPTFLVADVAVTVAWYVEQLGFVAAGLFLKDPPYAYASLQRDGAEIMLLLLRDYRKPDLADRRPEGGWDAYLRMDGVHSLYEQLKGRPFISSHMKQQPYGDWEFEVLDPNGYVLALGGAY